ncbi:cerebellar degeneration-related protein 2-like isoform X2 [Atheta coriaria]|uniref:cerebellar degeneration-related protein 2-like isoform X2 n=1 Tax=Dalotia coriaria TaxID=877792 RepID=UPI0031F3A581
MATYDELKKDFESICSSADHSTMHDLQLAAELGKTLLERNKELEITVKHHMNIIDDQTQEIEYLTKQTVALREVNDSRLRIYEQLEVSIQDLERANHRLLIDCGNEKKNSKSVTASLEASEQKCEELQATVDRLRKELDAANRELQAQKESNGTAEQVVAKYTRLNNDDDVDEVDRPESPLQTPTPHRKSVLCAGNIRTDKSQETQTPPNKDDKNSEVAQLLQRLQDAHAQAMQESRRITELEDQLQSMVQQNQELESQIMGIQQKGCEMKSMHEEFSLLEEVRQGQVCRKCGMVDPADDMSQSLCDDREDDVSMMDAMAADTQHRTSFYMEVQEYAKTSTPPREHVNLYRDLVEKYEALKKVQKDIRPGKMHNTSNMTLQEELAMSGDFKDTDEESGHGDSLRTEQQKKVRKTFSQTPTDFSEAETTSSSGYSDETSNKGTQTERRPGSFLCKIGDGEDCISIYDDAANIDGRFRQRPEFRELFGEIFSVLKKAAKNADENKELPLLDDECKVAPKVPPVTPCTEALPDFPDNCTDDTQSVLSSAMSELSTSQAEPITLIENIHLSEPVVKPQEPVLRPLIRQPLESLTGNNVRKRSSSRKKNKQFQDRSDSPVTHILGSPTIRYVSRPSSGRRRRGRDANQPNNENSEGAWNGSTVQFFSRNAPSPTPSQSSLDFKPSVASQELHKLKKLEKSYADVLRGNQVPKQRRDNYRGRRK